VRVLSIVHQPDAGAGVFGEAAAARGHELVEWAPAETSAPPLDGFGAAMVFGGAMNVHEEDDHPWLPAEKRLLGEVLASGRPMLGVCLGAELVAEIAGGSVQRASAPQIGWYEVERADPGDDPLLGPLPERFLAFQWHSYEFTLPDGGVPLAHNPLGLQAFRVGSAWGIQFHAEVTGASLDAWLDDYGKDADAVRIGVDPKALRAETQDRIQAWNELGRGIAGRFLDVAEGATPG
jgi:GMP synthase-like glutamine amidotransferase